VKYLLLIVITFSFTTLTNAQTGKLSGKLLNNKNEIISGASVVSLNGKGVSSDVEGRFSLNLPTGKQQIVVTALGYAKKIIADIDIVAGTTTELNIILETATKELENVSVKSSSARKETVNALLQFQKNTSTVTQVVSAEAIKRSPDKNTGEVLKRVPGTSIQEGKYLVVRGLSDRYNQAMLNGALLSSTEPDRKTFSFDIFPSQMIDNIIINKAFVPELPGEWAGGLVQINTKDVPSKNFLNIQIGTGFNTQTIGNDFYKYKGGSLDVFGFDDGTRALPNDLPTKSNLNNLSAAEKTDLLKQLPNSWSTYKNKTNFLPVLSKTFQLNGGFNASIGKKNKLGGIFAINYNRSLRRTEYRNSIYSITGTSASVSFDYNNNKYAQNILWGALGNLTLQLGNHSKISFRNILNVNSSDYTIKRTGKDFENDPIDGENIRATELGFRANTFFNTQLSGDHNLASIKTKLHWYGSFNILDQYIPDQRRIQYNQDPGNANNPYYLLISASQTSQKSGSRFFSFLNDYIYSGGTDVAKTFTLFDLPLTLKGGYMLQVKDRLFDSRPFSIYLPGFNPALQSLNESNVFASENFGAGGFAYNEISGNRFRYLANTILNAGFLQFDNQFSDKLRATWGARVENFDQLIGSTDPQDPRYVHSQVNDILPGANVTYKLNPQTNIRLAVSQTVVRPEFRELSPFAFFDFELGATVTGNKELIRTKINNLDLRYELYPKAGELITVGLFYKYFKNPIELFFNQSGAGSSSTFNYINADHAKGFGAEFEMRKKLDFSDALKNFTFQSNFSYIYNRVTKENAKLDRPMQGQSPYLINVSLQYDVEKLGLNTTVLFNQIGRRILYVGNQDYPPVWERSRPLFDLQFAKKVLKNKGEVKLNISDLLNKRAYFYHDIDNNDKYIKGSKDVIAIDRKYGTNVSISFSYSIK
jgi:outer membrane receptor for ferrienterochelin and colicin